MVKVCTLTLAAWLAFGPALALAQETGTPPVVDSTVPGFSLPMTEGDAPPVVDTTVPGFSLPMTEGDAPPALPGLEPAEPPVTGHGSDLSALILKAHPVVQAVMAALALSVAAVLTVFMFKAGEFALIFLHMKRAARALAGQTGLPDLAGDCPLAAASRAVRDEVATLPATLTPDLRVSARERLDLTLERIEAGAVQRLRSGTGLLASIGAVAPFVGLFGTVFGIMNSFLAIAETKTTSLAVVAPGIAEALLATGIGLVAAIPAVLVYNRCMRRIGVFRHRLADGMAELRRRFSHALDARMGAGD